MFQKNTLSNDLRVITVPMPQVKSATVLVLVKAGSRYENSKNNGISHFLEHMMFKGTTKRPNKSAISTLLDSIGGSFNAFTSKENTGFYVKAASEHLPLMMDVISDMVLNSIYDPAEVDRERAVITEEINGDEDDPLTRSFQLFEQTMFAPTPLAMRIAGEKETVGQISRDEIASYAQDMYHAKSMVLTVSGQIEKESTLKLATNYFGQVKSGKDHKFLPFTNSQAQPQALIYNKKTDQTHFCLGVPGVSLADERRYTAAILATILGGNMSSRLFIRIRDEMGLAYQVGSLFEEYQDTGLFVNYASVKTEKAQAAIEAILGEMSRLMTDEVTAEELKRAKDYAQGKMVLALEDTYKVAQYYGSQELLEDKIDTPEEGLKKLDKVTVEDIQTLAKDIFKTQYLNLALVGPFKEREKFETILKI